MAINITSFFGGMAKGAGRVLKENREQAREDKTTGEQRQWQIATEARQYALNKQQRLDVKAEQAEEYISQLVAMGMDLNTAKELAKGGKGAIEDAITNIQFGRENGVDAANFYTLKTEAAIPITGAEISEISKGPNLVIDSDAIKNMYGALDTDYTNHNQAIMSITNKQLRLNLTTPKGKAAFDQLEIQKNAFLKDLGKIAIEKDIPNDRLFGESTTINQINSAKANALASFEISMNIEDMTKTGISGKGIEVNVADLNAVRFLNMSLKNSSVQDPFMVQQVKATEEIAINNLINIAASKMREDATLAMLKDSISPDLDRELVIGDIIKVLVDDNSGRYTYSMYTGTKDSNNYITLYTGV